MYLFFNAHFKFVPKKTGVKKTSIKKCYVVCIFENCDKSRIFLINLDVVLTSFSSYTVKKQSFNPCGQNQTVGYLTTKDIMQTSQSMYAQHKQKSTTFNYPCRFKKNSQPLIFSPQKSQTFSIISRIFTEITSTMLKLYNIDFLLQWRGAGMSPKTPT